MTARLFIGGTWDGRWVDVRDNHPTYLVSVPTRLSAVFREADILAEPFRAGVATYHRRRAVVPGWRVPLTFWVIEGGDPFTERGYVLPGFVVGVRPEKSSLSERPQP